MCDQFSRELVGEQKQYVHDVYQVYAACQAQVLASTSYISMITMPTGSGKSYAIALLFHFMRNIVVDTERGSCINSKKILVEGQHAVAQRLKYGAVVPNELLKDQIQ